VTALRHAGQLGPDAGAHINARTVPWRRECFARRAARRPARCDEGPSSSVPGPTKARASPASAGISAAAPAPTCWWWTDGSATTRRAVSRAAGARASCACRSTWGPAWGPAGLQDAVEEGIPVRGSSHDGDGQHEPAGIPALLGVIARPTRTNVAIGSAFSRPPGPIAAGACAGRLSDLGNPALLPLTGVRLLRRDVRVSARSAEKSSASWRPRGTPRLRRRPTCDHAAAGGLSGCRDVPVRMYRAAGGRRCTRGAARL